MKEVRMHAKFEEIFKAVSEKSEVRPFNELGEKDGNRHFIHRQDVADSMVKVRELIEELEEENKMWRNKNDHELRNSGEL